MTALVEFYGHCNADELTDEEFAIKFNNIKWVRDQERARGQLDIAKLLSM